LIFKGAIYDLLRVHTFPNLEDGRFSELKTFPQFETPIGNQQFVSFKRRESARARGFSKCLGNALANPVQRRRIR
jgi:hypothetical protein